MHRSRFHFAEYHKLLHCQLDHLAYQEKEWEKTIAKLAVPNSLKGSSPISSSGEYTVSTKDSNTFASVGCFTKEGRKLDVLTLPGNLQTGHYLRKPCQKVRSLLSPCSS